MSNGAADSAYNLFLRSRSAVSAARYPDRLDYTIVASGIEGGRFRTNHYKGRYDSTDGSIRVLPISDEELADPAVQPHDFDFRQILIQGVSVPVGRQTDPDILGGSPLLEPTYAFGLKLRAVPEARSQTDDTVASLPVIAVVSNRARDYDVSLVDEPVLNGVETYHLRLTPIRRPKQYRLRELWLGANDFLPRQAVVAGNFTVAPLVDVPWLLSFEIRDGLPYVSREDAEDTLYLGHRHTVSDAEVRFSDVQESSGNLIGAPLITQDITPTSLVEP
jgi:hypothetical protein